MKQTCRTPVCQVEEKGIERGIHPTELQMLCILFYVLFLSSFVNGEETRTTRARILVNECVICYICVYRYMTLCYMITSVSRTGLLTSCAVCFVVGPLSNFNRDSCCFGCLSVVTRQICKSEVLFPLLTPKEQSSRCSKVHPITIT